MKITYYNVIQIKGLGYHGLDWEMEIKRQKERSRERKMPSMWRRKEFGSYITKIYSGTEVEITIFK